METKQAIESLAEQRGKIKDEILKAYTAPTTSTTGLQEYDLEAPAKMLYPVLTPLRNMIPRIKGVGNIQSNWKAITGRNTTRVCPGVSEGKRNAQIAHTMIDRFAVYKTLGLEDTLTDEADWAAEGFMDLKADATTGLLQATMIAEEMVDLGGNNSIALGTCPTPTLVSNATGGSIAQTITVSVYCVALTLDGYQQLVGRNNGTTGEAVDYTTAVLESQMVRTGMDLTTETVNLGTSIKSAVATVTTATDGLSTHSISASVTPVRGAVAYAWYWDITGTAASAKLGAVSTINSVLITAAATGTQTISGLFTTDCSQNSLVYDGILTQIMTSGSGAYFVDLATGVAGTGTALTSDGAGGCTQISAALLSFWELQRLSPQIMFMSARTQQAWRKIVIANGGAPLFRQSGGTGQNDITAGNTVSQYVNDITGSLISIQVHPNMPDGQIMFWSSQLPFPANGIRAPLIKRCQRDYWQEEWPRQTRRREYSIYMRGVLQMYYPPAFGLIRNIAV